MPVEAASHITQFDVAQPDGNDDISFGDNHLRMVKQVLQNDIPLPGRFMRSVAKTSNYVLGTGDYLSVIRVTATGVTISTNVAASVYGDGFMVLISAQGFSVTFDPNGSETVNGLTSTIIPVNSSALISTNGTIWTAMFGAGVGAGVGSSITTSGSLTVADVKQTRIITDGPADIVLPPTNTVAVGDTVALKSLTSKRTRVTGSGSETIDGVVSYYNLPYYELVEFTCSALGQWIISRKPGCYVGEIKQLRHGTVPLGWVVEDGSTLDQVVYGGLFSYLGTTYNRGDEAAGTFRLPTSSGRTVIGDGAGQLVAPIAPVNIDITANTIQVPGTAWRWQTGQAIRFNLISGIAPVTVPPGVLVNGAILYVVESGTDGLIRLATTLANAQNLVTIDFTSAGTGSFTLTYLLSGRFLGEYGGQEDHAQNANELLQHSHGGSTGSNGIPVVVSGGSNITAGIMSGPNNNTVASTSSPHQHAISNSGGNQAASIMQPFTVARFIIKV